jgi:hypothetical protein
MLGHVGGTKSAVKKVQPCVVFKNSSIAFLLGARHLWVPERQFGVVLKYVNLSNVGSSTPMEKAVCTKGVYG